MDCQLRNVRAFCGARGLEFFEKYMGEMSNSLINEHCVGYTFSDKCRPYQEVPKGDSTEEEGAEKGAGPAIRKGKKKKKSRVKSKLQSSGTTTPVNGATAASNSACAQKAALVRLLDPRSASFSWAPRPGLYLIFEVLGRIVANFTIIGSLYLALLEIHCF